MFHSKKMTNKSSTAHNSLLSWLVLALWICMNACVRVYSNQEFRGQSNRHHASFYEFIANASKKTFENMTGSKIQSKYLQQIMIFGFLAFHLIPIVWPRIIHTSYIIHFTECFESPLNRCCRWVAVAVAIPIASHMCFGFKWRIQILAYLWLFEFDEVFDCGSKSEYVIGTSRRHKKRFNQRARRWNMWSNNSFYYLNDGGAYCDVLILMRCLAQNTNKTKKRIDSQQWTQRKKRNYYL